MLVLLLLLSSPLPLSSRTLAPSCPWTEGDLSPFLRLPPEGQEEPPFAVCGPHVLPLVEMPEEETQNQVYQNFKGIYFSKVLELAQVFLLNPPTLENMDKRDLQNLMSIKDAPFLSLIPISSAVSEERDGPGCCWMKGSKEMKRAGYIAGAKSGTMVTPPSGTEYIYSNKEDLVLISAHMFDDAQKEIENSDFDLFMKHHFGPPQKAVDWPRAVWVYVSVKFRNRQKVLNEEGLRMVQYFLDLNSRNDFYFTGMEGTFKALYLYRGTLTLSDGNLLFRLDLNQGGRLKTTKAKGGQSLRRGSR